ncbi:hypothetical protein ACFV8Z_39095 [Streptomyces sp. NPDC059837]|uniref:hypothetical protein n=1 Tax=unclassified Streptomyces TaxID=2593676 RepID=UPI0022513B9A|nr:hypothetical protein [Streptomyces sp. NBC_01764]MCX4402222.1 hypothetical protein [Streptomyces sp. NBC_01764]
MHRTTTAATLLATVATAALSGCVTVQRPPAPTLSTAPSRPSPPRPDGRTGPQVVQAPAREALELIGPSRKPSPSAPAPHRTSVPAPAAPQAPAARHPHNAAPHPHPEPHPPAPRTAVPPAPQGLPNNTDVCALGRKYGGWKADSPEAVICKGTYGN